MKKKILKLIPELIICMIAFRIEGLFVLSTLNSLLVFLSVYVPMRVVYEVCREIITRRLLIIKKGNSY
ncbi:hypothetical protein EDC18_101500 [Natranaerovirga pectinivora]|uniref:Uncharacterized protein n=1 Tax=Natranaerovirga pectinivora TaxID=682400 RepID=A0A4R3MQM5_9FIRM|nr:hypothetical protein [Natranaerovirga pectinivora]TCT17202.1 hypothetical protein EDC18_101500 [Natranaerovirga pectinivora]